jgi:hypothetical protein
VVAFTSTVIGVAFTPFTALANNFTNMAQ